MSQPEGQVTIEQAIAIGMQHHRAGNLQEAERVYRQILAVAPDHPDATHYLGVIAHQVGRNDLAEPLLRKSIERKPSEGSFHNNLGQVLRALGKPADAEQAYRRALELGPRDLDARLNLAITLRETGRPADAIDMARSAVDLDPARLDARLQLAFSLHAANDRPAARDILRQVLDQRPDYSEALEVLGVIEMADSRPAQAEPAFRRASELLPGSATPLIHLGNALYQLGQTQPSADAFTRALALDARSADAHIGLSRLYLQAGRPAEALAHAEAAAAVAPASPSTQLTLGAALAANHRLEDAIVAWKHTLDAEPANVPALNNIAAALATTGSAHEAIPHYHRALALDPSMSQVRSNMLLDMHYVDTITPDEIFAEHLDYGRRLVRGRPPHVASPDPARKLRVGYFSPDFRAHSVADFTAPLLIRHDRARFEVVCYANVHAPDIYTDRLRSYADLWRDVASLTDEQAAAAIRDDAVDILVDLAGHTAHGRLEIFARRPAPVQITYLGYPDTTGLPDMDYRITDVQADPPGTTEKYHTEKLLRLPRTAWCYHAYSLTPPVAAPPFETAGQITFGSFNNLAKVTPGAVALWAQVLAASPNSRLLIKASGLSSASARARLLSQFDAHGIDPTRVELLGRIEDFIAHLAAYSRIDIALDTFPYHGTTTTCEAFYMGVPVITLAGQTHVSRVGVSLLTNVGLPDLIATSRDDYVRIAANLATGLPRLRDLRRTLRPTMESSPLMDAPRFVRDVEDAYRHAWTDFCAAPRA